jgi:hypothetical protein
MIDRNPRRDLFHVVPLRTLEDIDVIESDEERI